MLIGSLGPRAPYDFAKMLDVMGRFQPVMDVARDGEYWRALRVGAHLALVRVRSRGTVDDPALDVYRMAATGAVDNHVVLGKLRHLLSTDMDMNPFYAFARTDSPLWETVEPLRGLHFIRAESIFEALLTTIIEQQIALTAALRAQRWLVEWAGNGIAYNGETFYAFATPAQVAAAQVADLKPLKITFRRMQLLIDVAQQQASGQLDLESLRQGSAQAAYESLVRIRGVGHWTAAWTLTRGLGAYDAVGHNDVALQAAVNLYYYGQSGRATAQAVGDMFAGYGEYAGLAAFHTLMRWVFDRYDPLAPNFTTTDPLAPPPE